MHQKIYQYVLQCMQHTKNQMQKSRFGDVGCDSCSNVARRNEKPDVDTILWLQHMLSPVMWEISQVLGVLHEAMYFLMQ